MELGMGLKQSILNRLKSIVTTEHYLIGASLARIGFGVNILFYYLMHIALREFIWGPSGVYPWDRFVVDSKAQGILTLYQLSSSDAYFNIIFFMGLIINILYLVGYKTRITGVLNYVFIWSLYERNSFTLDGGDNLLILCMFYLMFANVSAYLSFDKSRLKQKNKPTNPFLATLHNFAVLACVSQLLVMYMTSGLYKAQGKMWIHGTALYYVMRVKEFSLPVISPFIYSHPFLVTLGTYVTVLFQLAFPFLIWNKYTKWMMAFGSLFFHLMIAIVMGLVFFGMSMVTVDLLLFNDSTYLRIGKWMNGSMDALSSRVRNFAKKSVHQISQFSVLQRQKIVVLYDSFCPMCTSIVSKWEKMDVFQLIEFQSFRSIVDPLSEIGITYEALDQRMHSRRVVDGKYVNGIDSIIQVSARVPAMWALVPFLVIGRLVGLGQVVYDFISKNRQLIPIGHCKDDACSIDLSNHKTSAR